MFVLAAFRKPPAACERKASAYCRQLQASGMCYPELLDHTIVVVELAAVRKCH